MRAIDLTLNHTCYKTDIDTIEEAIIEGIIRSVDKKKVRIGFIGDNKLYVVPNGAQSVFKLYFFSLEEAELHQKKLREKSLLASMRKEFRASKDYASLMKSYGDKLESKHWGHDSDPEAR